MDERDIQDVRSDDLRSYVQCHFFAGIGGWPYALRLAGFPDDKSVWTGSCPCQPFSNAGSRKGERDERHLWPVFFDLIAQCRPAIVFGEQVASKLGREWLAGVRTDLERAGYAVGATDLPAACVGAPHIRQRLFWLADADDGQPSDRNVQRSWQYGQQSQDDSTADRMADDSQRRSIIAQRDGEPFARRAVQQRPDFDRCSDADGLGDDDDARLALGSLAHDGRRAVRQERSAAGAAGAEGFWSASGLIRCADGKARRIPQSAFQRLADGLPVDLDRLRAEEGYPLAVGVEGRVGLLRGFGNAINPYVAKKFIEAYLHT